MFDELFPILSTPDVARSLGFYRDRLGGDVTYRFPQRSSHAVGLHG
ncbi:MAG TPA: hypothetical protein VFE14_07995 [Micromonosporaceae bacterium]|jgi:lactoylglutathione lyase|nr:hypothetical protein [Micromonosporaceae bacterium]